MRRITEWSRNLGWLRRETHSWRGVMLVPVYLRYAPLRTLRERLAFISRIEPRIALTFNVANTRRFQIATAPAVNVFLNRWLTLRATAAPKRVEVATSAQQFSHTQAVPAGWVQAAMRIAAPARVVLPVESRTVETARPVATRSMETESVVERLRQRTQRIHEMTPEAPSRLVKAPAAAANAPATDGELPGMASRQRTWPAAGTESMARIQPSTPQIDTERLAEQVLKQIDRRVIASRERMGRI